MPRPGPFRRLAAWLPAVLLCTSAWAAPEQPAVKISLDWVFTGAHAPYVLALEGGAFARQGLQVTLERGHGAGDAVRRLAAGEVDVAIADLGMVIEHNARHPQGAVTAFYLVHDRSPLAVISLEEAQIRSVQDLRGKVLGAPEGEAGRSLFPVLAAEHGLVATDLTWRSTDPALRESLLVAGQVDAITGYAYTAVQFLEMQGIRRERVRVLRYADHGPPLYGVALIARADFLRRQPRTAAAVARAVNEALQATIAQPPLAIDAMRRRLGERWANDLELQRLRLALEDVVTPHVRQHGLSQVDWARLQRVIEAVSAGLKLPRQPDAQQVYTESFLPPREERLLPAVAAVTPRSVTRDCRPAPGGAVAPGCR